MICRVQSFSCARLRWIQFAAVLLVLLWAQAANAAIIFNNGGPLLTPAIAQGASFADANNFNFNEAADNFSLLANTNTIRDLHWWGVYGTGIANPPTDVFSVRIYNDSGNTVGSLNTPVVLLNLSRTNTGQTINGFTMYKYDADITPISLTAGTQYWLGISNDSSSNNWGWVNSANSGGNAKQFSLSNNTWGNTNKELAFNLTNDPVPEPSTFVLGALGLLGMCVVARRKQNRVA